MHSSFDKHEASPGRLLLNEEIPSGVRTKLKDMGYELEYNEYTSGPLNAIFFDRKHDTFWGGSSNYGDDYGIGW